MSVMQVVGSSRISNTVYLGVASIYWTLYITLAGFTLTLDVQTALLLVTPPAGIAALLWVLRVEEYIIIKLLLFLFPRSTNGKFIRYHMGYSVIHIQPWKETLDETTTIYNSLRGEVKRVLGSPFLKEEMESLFQLFWLLISTPAIFILLGLQLRISVTIFGALVNLSLLLDFVLVFVILIRKRKWPYRILGQAYCNWYKDMIGGMDRRRVSFSLDRSTQSPLGKPKFFPQRESISTAFIEKTTPWIDELVALVNREDWQGFEQNLSTFLNSQDVYYKKLKDADIYTSLVNDIIWSFKREIVMGPYEKGVTISFEQAHPLGHRIRTRLCVFDALVETDGLRPKTSTVIWISYFLNFLKSWDNLLKWNDVYEILPNEIVEELPQITMQAITELPFFLEDQSIKIETIWAFRGNKRLWKIDSILCLQKAIDRNLIDPGIVFSAATRWEILPKDYIKQCSSKMKPLILETETNLPLIELKYVANTVIRECSHLDTDKIAKNLLRYKDDPEFKEIVKQIENLTLRPEKSQAVRAKTILEKMGITSDSPSV